MSASLLVELFTEELPPKALKRLGNAFADAIARGLQSRGLMEQSARTTAFATPRRLAVHISSVHAKGKDAPLEQKLMPLSVARTAEGKASEALRRKLAGLGRGHLADSFPDATGGPDSLSVKSDGKADSVYLCTLAPGQMLARALDESLRDAIEGLPIPKLMSYQLADGTSTVQFVRPAHGLVALHGDRIVDVSALGLKAGRITHGHRFQGVKDIEVKTADAYREALAAHGRVIASFDERRAETETQLRAKAAELKASLGAEADVAPLLDEVSALVEYPSVYAGEFESEFLVVPQECLVLTMRTNQKYFPLFEADGKLTNRFLIVSNMRLEDPKNVVEGNQRVVRPRLADARFFFETDKKTKLADRVPQLANVTYHNKLGSQLERVERVRVLAQAIARKIGADPALAGRAALLAKADLVTNMVGEFPELQGVMGRYYALADGENAQVADALEQQYRPRFAGDTLPDNEIAIAVALADKLETLVGMFGIGQRPSGDRDPFALRRHALGILRILMEKRLALDLDSLLRESQSTFPPGKLADVRKEKGISIPLSFDIGYFVQERAKGYLRDRGYSVSEVEAVLTLRNVNPSEYIGRLNAVRRFLTLAEAPELAESDKRIRNIINKSAATSMIALANEKECLENAEKKLLHSVRALRPQVDLLIHQENFEQALLLTAQINLPVKQFFDDVMVNVEDTKTRNNRFALLHEVGNLTNRVANLSALTIAPAIKP
jgi:glycyl-tRNA synthetase beta chain